MRNIRESALGTLCGASNDTQVCWVNLFIKSQLHNSQEFILVYVCALNDAAYATVRSVVRASVQFRFCLLSSYFMVPFRHQTQCGLCLWPVGRSHRLLKPSTSTQEDEKFNTTSLNPQLGKLKEEMQSKSITHKRQRTKGWEFIPTRTNKLLNTGELNTGNQVKGTN